MWLRMRNLIINLKLKKKKNENLKICRLGGLGKKDEVGAFFLGGGEREGWYPNVDYGCLIQKPRNR